jgi:acyl-CoA hydrolase
MEVEVTVHAEDLDNGIRVLTGTAFVTVVALDDEGKPTEIPPLNLDSDNDKRRFRGGESRMITRLKDAGRVWTSKTTSQSG